MLFVMDTTMEKDSTSDTINDNGKLMIYLFYNAHALNVNISTGKIFFLVHWSLFVLMYINVLVFEFSFVDTWN